MCVFFFKSAKKPVPEELKERKTWRAKQWRIFQCFSRHFGAKKVTPWKMNGWNLRIRLFEKENHLDQTIIFRFKLLIFWGVHPLFLFPRFLHSKHLSHRSDVSSPWMLGTLQISHKRVHRSHPVWSPKGKKKTCSVNLLDGLDLHCLGYNFIFSLPSFQIKTNSKLKITKKLLHQTKKHLAQKKDN